MVLKKYRCYCTVDLKNVHTDYRSTDPTVCPENSAHAIDTAKTVVVDQVTDANQEDPESALVVRIKMAPKGWTYDIRGLEFSTSTLNSIKNSDQNEVAYGDAILKFYERITNADGTTSLAQITGANLTQTYLDTNCVKTVIDLEPSYSYEIIGGYAKISAAPANDVRLYVVAVPDLPAPNGSKMMVRNVNFRFIGPTSRIEADGRTSKRLDPDPTYHTNKLSFQLLHGAGEKHNIMIALEHYKA